MPETDLVIRTFGLFAETECGQGGLLGFPGNGDAQHFFYAIDGESDRGRRLSQLTCGGEAVFEGATGELRDQGGGAATCPVDRVRIRAPFKSKR